MSRILVIEDDRFQAEDIQDNLLQRCAAQGLRVEVLDVIETEEAAQRFVRSDGMQNVDLFVVDLMLPWSRSTPPPDPMDPRVRTEGAIRAGFRVIEALRDEENQRGIAHRPVILYTVATLLAAGNGHQDALGYYRIQKTDDQEEALAKLITNLLGPSRQAAR